MLPRFLVGSRLPARIPSRSLRNHLPILASRAPRRAFSASLARHGSSSSNTKCSSDDLTVGGGVFIGALLASISLIGGHHLWSVATRVPYIDDTPIAVRREVVKSPDKEMAVTTDGRYLVEDESGNWVEIKNAYGGNQSRWLNGDKTRRRSRQDEKEKAQKEEERRKELRETTEMATRRSMALSGFKFVERTPNGIAIYEGHGLPLSGVPMNGTAVPPGAVLTTGSSTSSETRTGNGCGGCQHDNGGQNGTGNCLRNFDDKRRQYDNASQIRIGNSDRSGNHNRNGAPNMTGTGGSNQNESDTSNGTGSPNRNGGRWRSW